MTGIFTRIDHFIARHIYAAPIKALSKATRQSTNEIAGCFLVISAILGSWMMLKDPQGIIDYFLGYTLAIICAPAAYISIFVYHVEYTTSSFWRGLFIINTLITILIGDLLFTIVSMTILGAEHAALIRNLPPSSPRENTAGDARKSTADPR